MRLDQQGNNLQLTEGVAAIKHFTDREEALGTFARYLAAPEGTLLPVINFYGVGGIGKSLLLRKLRDGLEVPFVLVDLEEERLRDRLTALMLLRGQFGRAGIDCPGFDMHRSVLMAKEGGADEELFAINPVLREVANGILGAFASQFTSFADLGTRLVSNLGKDAEELLRKMGGTERVLELRQYQPIELTDMLPAALVEDLAANLPARPGHACRGVIFIDTFEKLWEGREGPHLAQDQNRDLWLRQLFLALCTSQPGILLVISGRDALHWPKTDPGWCRMTPTEVGECLESHLLGGLSPQDTQRYLSGCGIGQPPEEGQPDALQAAIIACASSGDTQDGCLPFYAGLCAEIVLMENGVTPPAFFAKIPSKDVATRLAKRFLTSVAGGEHQELLYALSLCRWFDAHLLEARCGGNRAAGGNAFKMLEAYSFTDSLSGGRLTLHAVMRDALQYLMLEYWDKAKVEAEHEWFRQYFQQRAEEEPSAEMEAWYHHLHVAPVEAVQ